MAEHTLKILRCSHHKIFWSMFGHFSTLWKKGLTFAVEYWKALKWVGTWEQNWLIFTFDLFSLDFQLFYSSFYSLDYNLPYYKKLTNHEISTKCLSSASILCRSNFQFILFPYFSPRRLQFFRNIFLKLILSMLIL